MDSAQIPEITNDNQPQITEQNNPQFGLIITILLIIIFVGVLIFFLFTEEKPMGINTPDKPIGYNTIPTPLTVKERPTALPTIAIIPTLTTTPNNQVPSEKMYYKNITGGANLLGQISKTNKTTLFSGIECELLEVENLGNNFEITNKNIRVKENDWFVRIKVKAKNPDSTSHTLDLDLTDGIENIYLYEYSLNGQISYPSNIEPNSTQIIEVVMLISNPHDKIYLLPRGYSSQEKLEIIPLNI